MAGSTHVRASHGHTNLTMCSVVALCCLNLSFKCCHVPARLLQLAIEGFTSCVQPIREVCWPSGQKSVRQRGRPAWQRPQLLQATLPGCKRAQLENHTTMGRSNPNLCRDAARACGGYPKFTVIVFDYDLFMIETGMPREWSTKLMHLIES